MNDTSHTLSVILLLGTNRKDRRSEYVARIVRERMSARNDMNVSFFDARDFQFPKEGYGPDIMHVFPEWNDAVTSCDGMVIVSPEYNHGYPGILKSILDTISREQGLHKCSGIVGVSSGMIGGARMTQALLAVLRTLGFVNIWHDVYTPNVNEALDEQGNFVDEKQIQRIDSFLDEFVWQAEAQLAQREKTS